ncbi:MAG: hypothetical protein RL338_160 [Chloroflexota bacterium]
MSGAAGRNLPAGLDRVRARRLLVDAPLVHFPLHPGDRALVEPGEVVQVGGPLLERARAAAAIAIAPGDVPAGARSGDWWTAPGRRIGLRRGRAGVAAGELLYEGEARWHAVVGDRTDVVEAPVAGIVRAVRPGLGIALATTAAGIPGSVAVGGPTRGRIEVAIVGDGELRSSAIDIHRAGAVVVGGARIDAETITRARAMGVRGVVAGAVASRELRDLAASEARQRASLQPIPPFAVLALEGHARSPIAGPVAGLLAALAGRPVAIVADPPLLLVEGELGAVPLPPPDLVRVRSGPLAGTEGRWGGPAGRRRFEAGVVLEAGIVELEGGGSAVVPLADLERFA